MICKTTVCREVLGPSGTLPQGHPLLMYVSGAVCVLLFLYILKRIFWLIFGTKNTLSFFTNILKIGIPLAIFFVSMSVFMAQRNSSVAESRFAFIKDAGIRDAEIQFAKAESDLAYYDKSGVVPSHTLIDILNGQFVKRNGGTVVIHIENDPHAEFPDLSKTSTLTFTSAAGKSVTVPIDVFVIQKRGINAGHAEYSNTMMNPKDVKSMTITNPSLKMSSIVGGFMQKNKIPGEYPVYQKVTGVDLTAYYGDVYKDGGYITNDLVTFEITNKNLSDVAQVFDNPSDLKIVMR
ncbi:hypothetical protein [Acetobacter orientalis]|uniref:hypothetical protein n=1 Tax=Acetobacter orientalis TaxID=146474 RepID=UPI0039EB9937